MTNKTRVAVLGTLADLHREPIRYNLACLTRLVEELNPDLLCAELPRALWERGDTSDAPIEYREALIPLAARTNIVIVPIQGQAGCQLVAPQAGPLLGVRRIIARWLDDLLRWLQRRASDPEAINSSGFGQCCWRMSWLRCDATPACGCSSPRTADGGISWWSGCATRTRLSWSTSGSSDETHLFLTI
jgi:hypothetical protein